MIRKHYGRSVVAVLLIPVVALLGGLRLGLAMPLLELTLWLLACIEQLRAKSRRLVWLWLAALGPPGFAVLTALADRSPLTPADAYERRLSRLPKVLRVLYELVLFVAFGFLSLQLVQWYDYGTALADAARRGITLAQVLAERDASSGMWAFGDLFRAAYVLVLIYALWPGVCNGVGVLVRRLQLRGAAA